MTDLNLPLCVDLDGTLTPVDTLHESLVALIRHQPLTLFLLPVWLFRGKAAFKREVASRVPLDASALPLNHELLDWLHAQKRAGRRLVLSTASHRSTAEAVAARLELFDEVVATDDGENLAAEGKRLALVRRFGDKGFEYVGNSSADLAVWPASAGAVVVGDRRLAAEAATLAPLTAHFSVQRAGLRTWIKALRLHQWVKNFLIFAPLVLAHEIGNLDLVLATLLAFVSFGLCASSVYVFNDLLDLESDRRHPRKRERPFASGALPVSQGVGVGVLLLIAAVAVGTLVNPWFLLALGAYFLFTSLYSLRLKRYALIDVMMLAGLYTMRVIAGGAATLIPPSFWLLAFCILLFLSLGIVKRYAELDSTVSEGNAKAHGRGYWPDDLALLQSLGTASAYSAVVVMALYIYSASSSELYRHPELLWLTCPILLFWVSRVWLLTTRHHMHDDPIVFALSDRISLYLAAITGTVVLVAT